jgi:hypothetical protein
MSLPEFIAGVLTEGRGAVPPPEDVSAEERAQTGQILAEFERGWRLELPGEAPAFHAESAVWAATQFYLASQYAVFRDAGPDFAFVALPGDRELGALPATHYSVDLTFRFLPDLVRHVRAAASEDPLGVELVAWSQRWPLSSVGVTQLDSKLVDAALAPVVGHASLLRIYVDRIIDRGDVSRLSADTVRQAVAAAIGLHDDLAPQLVKVLRTQQLVTP